MPPPGPPIPILPPPPFPAGSSPWVQIGLTIQQVIPVSTVMISGDTQILNNKTVAPSINGQGFIGTSVNKFAEVNAVQITSGDLHLRDDDRNAHWVLREETNRIVAINKITGKRYAIALTPIDDTEEGE